MQKNNIEIFRADEQFRHQLADGAKRMCMEKSAFIRWAVTMAIRMSNRQTAKDDV